jgi:hypothetical protein
MKLGLTVPNLGPLAAFVRHSSVLCRSSRVTCARLVARGGDTSSFGRIAIADHLALLYGRMQRVGELVAEESLPPQYGGSNFRKGTTVVALGAYRGVPAAKAEWPLSISKAVLLPTIMPTNTFCGRFYSFSWSPGGAVGIAFEAGAVADQRHDASGVSRPGAEAGIVGKAQAGRSSRGLKGKNGPTGGQHRRCLCAGCVSAIDQTRLIHRRRCGQGTPRP